MNGDEKKTPRHAKRTPVIHAKKNKSNMRDALPSPGAISVFDLMLMDGDPNDEKSAPQFQDEETAARSKELVFAERDTLVKDTFISAPDESAPTELPINIVFPKHTVDEEAKNNAPIDAVLSIDNTVDKEEKRDLSETFIPAIDPNTLMDEIPPLSTESADEYLPMPLTKELRIAIGITAVALCISVLSVAYSFFHNDTVHAYEVSIGGKTLGYVEDHQEVVKDYTKLLSDNKNVEALNLSFSAAAVPAASVLTKEEETALLYMLATEGYVRGYTVTVNEEAVAYALGTEEITHAIDTLYSIRQNDTDTSLLAGGTLRCTSDIQWEYGYVKESDISDTASLISVLGKEGLLSYVIERTVTVPEILRYSTEFRDNDENFNGITLLISPGKNGIASAEYLQTVDPVSGEVLTSKHLKTTVIEPPVNAVSYYGEYPLLDESVCTDTFIFPIAEPEDNTWVIGTQVMSVPKIYLSSGYGGRSLWGAYDFHLGYDIAAPRGTEILACDGGIAIDVGYSDSYGYFIRLQHRNGIETMYAHMSERLVKEGEYVTQGQVIGLVGATGNTSGNHLHVEFRKDHVTCDPSDYIPLPDWVLLEKDKETEQ